MNEFIIQNFRSSLHKDHVYFEANNSNSFLAKFLEMAGFIIEITIMECAFILNLF